MRNKLIIVEGTDCSGKQTQTEMVVDALTKMGIGIKRYCFPNYDSPTGKIIGGNYLGKEQYGQCIFPEGASNVDPKVAGLYYSADRLYNMPKIKETIANSHIILDRYVDSNMAHQGGKVLDKKQRYKMYKWFSNLEYKCLGLPKADIKVLLYMPYEYACKLKSNREEKPDQHEMSPEHLKNAEKSYLEIAKIHKYKIINCVNNGQIRTVEDIHNELMKYLITKLKIKQ